MRSVVKYRRKPKQLKNIALYLKSPLARPPFYDRAYPQKLSTASPGVPVGSTKPSFFYLSNRIKCRGSVFKQIMGVIGRNLLFDFLFRCFREKIVLLFGRRCQFRNGNLNMKLSCFSLLKAILDCVLF